MYKHVSPLKSSFNPYIKHLPFTPHASAMLSHALLRFILLWYSAALGWSKKSFFENICSLYELGKGYG